MDIELTVAYVKFAGNTGNGAYFYAFNPSTIFASGKDCELRFHLADDLSDEFEMVDVVSSDGGTELKTPTIEKGGRSAHVIDANSKRQVISVSVIVRDVKRGKLINCDPQVLNSPDPW
jgi:hypothetical protein